jgi:hypothetical protein
VSAVVNARTAAVAVVVANALNVGHVAKAASVVVMIGSVVVASAVPAKIVRRSRVSSNVPR